MRKAVVSVLVLFGLFLSTGILFGETYQAVQVENEFVNVRETNDSNSKLLGQAKQGRIFSVVNEAPGGWYAVITSGKQVGYVKKEYCKQIKNWLDGRATEADVKLRDKPDRDNSNVLAKVQPSEVVQVLAKSGEWYTVSVNGKKGYIRSDVLSVASLSGVSSSVMAASGKPAGKAPAVAAAAPAPRNKNFSVSRGGGESGLIAFAQSQLGKPYEWGRSGPDAFDCSGFVMYSYKNALGVSLPHSSAAMSQVGTTVEPSEMIPGDLVFFATGGGNQISHVGIYVGGGQFIHSSDSPKHGNQVVISTLTSGYYNERFQWAKRVIN